jgi:hypothetical protein
MIAVCPNGCSKKRFSVGVVEYHDWEVDENGDFQEDLGCKESEKPQSDALWTCLECGAESKVSN